MALEAFNAALAKQLELREATNRNLEGVIGQGMFSLTDGAFGKRSQASLEQEKQGIVASVQQSIAEAMQSGDDAKIFEAMKRGAITLQSVDPDSAKQLMDWYTKFATQQASQQRAYDTANKLSASDVKNFADSMSRHLTTKEMLKFYSGTGRFTEDDLKGDQSDLDAISRSEINKSLNSFVFALELPPYNLNRTDISKMLTDGTWKNVYKKWASVEGIPSIQAFALNHLITAKPGEEEKEIVVVDKNTDESATDNILSDPDDWKIIQSLDKAHQKSNIAKRLNDINMSMFSLMPEWALNNKEGIEEDQFDAIQKWITGDIFEIGSPANTYFIQYPEQLDAFETNPVQFFRQYKGTLNIAPSQEKEVTRLFGD
jgi:hypothetical protein